MDPWRTVARAKILEARKLPKQTKSARTKERTDALRISSLETSSRTSEMGDLIKAGPSSSPPLVNWADDHGYSLEKVHHAAIHV